MRTATSRSRASTAPTPIRSISPRRSLRTDAGAVPSLRLTGDGSLTSRLWTKPAIAVLAVDAPAVADVSNQIVPVARAAVSLRVAPGQDADSALAALDVAPRVERAGGARSPSAAAPGEPFRVSSGLPAHHAMRRAFAEAYGVPSHRRRTGGSIPFLASFAEAFPDAALLLLGVEDPASNAHSENESLHLGDFEKACVAEALFLGYLGDLKHARRADVIRRPRAR